MKDSGMASVDGMTRRLMQALHPGPKRAPEWLRLTIPWCRAWLHRRWRKRVTYPGTTGKTATKDSSATILWILAFCHRNYSVVEIGASKKFDHAEGGSAWAFFESRPQ
jgi:hypothetical protein